MAYNCQLNPTSTENALGVKTIPYFSHRDQENPEDGRKTGSKSRNNAKVIRGNMVSGRETQNTKTQQKY